MELSKPLMLNTQVYLQRFGKPFYDDFQTFYDECYGDAKAYVYDICFDRICEWYGIWEDLDTYDEVLELGNDVLEEMKWNAKNEFNRIKDETEDIDFDPNEYPYIEIDIPNDNDIFNAYIDHCDNDCIGGKANEEIGEKAVEMTAELYSSSEISDLEDEYIINYILDEQSETPDVIENIVKNHDLTKLQKIVETALNEYHER